MNNSSTDMALQLGRGLSVFGIVIVIGAVGYYIIGREHDWTLLDSLYMAVITVSTVGFREVHEQTPVARVFTIILILFGVGAFTYLATSVGNYVIAGELQGLWSKRRMRKKTAELSDHFIVCAYGRMGSQVADEFKRQQCPVVVIDTSEEVLEKAVIDGHLAVLGNAGNDDVLQEAGVERAAGLVTCIDSDASNLLVVLSARTLNEKLLIVSRTNNHETTSKLHAAGANRVLWPYGLGGRRMAQMALRPNVVEFLEVVMHDEELELVLEELTIAIGSALDGKRIGSSEIRERTGAMLVAIRQRAGKMLIAPSTETLLEAGDIVVALGTHEQLAELQEMAIS